MSLTVGSLFSGIGGLDLGLERAGMTVRWQSEVEPFCCRVLAKHWPAVLNLGDVTEVDWERVERVDLVCGGYPCQPFSLAGARRGENDTRHLWPHMRDAIGVLRPRFALLENVPGHLSMGFGRVLGDLAELGYDTEWDCIPAAAVGAPHLRYRVFIVAHADSGRRGEGGLNGVGRALGSRRSHPGDAATPENPSARPAVADSDISGLQGHGRQHGLREDRQEGQAGRRSDVGHPDFAPEDAFTTRRGSRGTAGESGWWTTEPDVGRVAHGVPRRVDRLRALGNAVVPQVAEFIGLQLIESLESVA